MKSRLFKLVAIIAVNIILYHVVEYIFIHGMGVKEPDPFAIMFLGMPSAGVIMLFIQEIIRWLRTGEFFPE